MSQRRNTSTAPSRTRYTLVLAGAAAALAACSADRVSGPEAAAPVAAAPTAASYGKAEDAARDAGMRLTPTQLAAAATTFRTTAANVEAPVAMPLPISCGFTGRYMVSQRIGKAGGSLWFGRSEFRVPSGALASDVTITADITLAKEGVSVKFGPHGLKFAKAAEMRVDFTGCTVPAGASLNVYYTDDSNRITQTMPSSWTAGSTQIRALTDHFSGFTVSWGRR